MPQRKAFGCFNERSKIKKSFFNCPRPDCSVQARNTCQAWLLNLRNASLPKKIDDYVWKRADLVCEDHFAPDSFDQINGTFVSELAKSLNYRQKKRLKPDAVPTIVNTSCVDKTTGYISCSATAKTTFRSGQRVRRDGCMSSTQTEGADQSQSKKVCS